MRPWCSSLLSEVRSLGVLLRPKAAGYDKAMAAVLATRSPEFRKHLSNLLTEPPTDSQMRALLTGKSVIVIGPAGYTERRLGLSSSVSSFDVVVRPNAKVTHDGRLLLPPGTTDRCDVVYHSGVYLGKKLAGPNGLVAATQRNAMSNATLQIYSDSGVKAVIITTRRDDRVQYFTCLAAPLNSNLVLGSVRWPGSASTGRLDHFRTGLMSILDVLRFRPKKLRLLGFDFYQTAERGFRGYYEDEVAMNASKDGRRKPTSRRAKAGDSPWHDSLDELNSFRDCILRRFSAVIEIDDHLRGVLSNASRGVNKAANVSCEGILTS